MKVWIKRDIKRPVFVVYYTRVFLIAREAELEAEKLMIYIYYFKTKDFIHHLLLSICQTILIIN